MQYESLSNSNYWAWKARRFSISNDSMWKSSIDKAFVPKAPNARENFVEKGLSRKTSNSEKIVRLRHFPSANRWQRTMTAVSVHSVLPYHSTWLVQPLYRDVASKFEFKMRLAFEQTHMDIVKGSGRLYSRSLYASFHVDTKPYSVVEYHYPSSVFRVCAKGSAHKTLDTLLSCHSQFASYTITSFRFMHLMPSVWAHCCRKRSTCSTWRWLATCVQLYIHTAHPHP